MASQDIQENMKTTRRTFFGAAIAASPVFAQQDGLPEICRAALSGDTARARALLKDSPDLIHTRAADGRTPLYFAAESGSHEMLMLIISSGAAPRNRMASDSPSRAASASVAACSASPSGPTGGP